MALRQMPHHAFLLGLLTFLPFTAASGALAEANSHLFAQAERVADENVNKTIEATVWLKLHNQQELDSKVAGLYRAGSPTYHQWLKANDISHFAPSAAELQAVRRELVNKGLNVTAVDDHSMFVKVKGSVGVMQTAFNTQIKSLTVKGKVLRATTSEPKMTGATAGMVASISGLSERRYVPDSKRPIDPDTGKVYPGVPLSSAPKGIFFASNCFRDPQTHLFEGATELPVGVYAGNRYGANITNSTLGTLPPCGYDAVNLTSAYGLPAAYARGLDGTGQTIVIVDAYGSPTIADDANAFSQINGLPPLTPSNFQVINPLGPAQATDPNNLTGWGEEISLDVEWAHAVAPGANIVLVVSPSDYDTDFAATLFYAVVNQIGNVISNSYNGDEYDDLTQYPQQLVIANSVSELAASLGIAVNFSSGDNGDLEAVVGVKTVGDLSASPYATSVGGTSLAINAKNKRKFQTGWGTNITKLASADGSPLDPPLVEGFLFGSGGGESVYYPKPAWQASLPGTGRQQPDVSLDADPYTGVEFVITEGGEQLVGAIGGTSLACPTFSAVWAIANQLAGEIHGPGTTLGQAAPIVASLAGTYAITDVLPVTSATNVAGIVFDGNGPTYYTPDQLAAPLENTTEYLSELYNGLSGSWYTLTFGTDSSLTTSAGWDNVTGYGTPNGLTFIKAAAK